MNNYIWAIITTKFRATHKWPNCNIEKVKFLKNEHHHEFNVRVHIQQFHNERDVEYICFQDYLDKKIKKMLTKLKKYRSCEHMSTYLFKQIKKDYPDRLLKVEVNEDNYYGAFINEKDEENDLAWLAGIIDGEGSIYLTEHRYRPCIFIGNYNKKMIDKVYSIIQKNDIKQNKIFIEKSTPKRKLSYPFYRVAITGFNNVYELLNIIDPFLIAKNKQAKILKKYCLYRLSKRKTYRNKNKKFNRNQYMKFFSPDNEAKKVIAQLRKLNDSRNKK